MTENLPPMPFSEIRPFYRWRDYWLWLGQSWRAAVLFFGLVWRVYDVYPDGSNYRLSVRTSASVAWSLWLKNSPRFRAALYRACRARGYLCVPCDLQYQYQEPERSRR